MNWRLLGCQPAFECAEKALRSNNPSGAMVLGAPFPQASAGQTNQVNNKLEINRASGQPRKPDLIVKAAPLLWCEKARFVETSD
jgi:hypothetical protein